MAFRKIPVEESVGMVLPHDMTEIVPGKKKGPSFRKGHVVREEDVPALRRMGKNHIYVLELTEDDLHEDEAAMLMGGAIAGPGIDYDEKPSEGKVGFRAAIDGLLKVDRKGLFEFNLLGEVMLATRHDNTVVRKGDAVAGARAIPLVVARSLVEKAASTAERNGGLIRVKPFRLKKAAVVVTGQEVYEGRIKDAFGPVMGKKLARFGIEVLSVRRVPDDEGTIAAAIESAVESGAGLILCTGGMSVDPDDVTRAAVRKAGATDIVYGSPVLPGAMFLAGYIGDVTVLGIPACGMFFRTTVLDLVLPRVLTGERINREKLAEMGHGGFCLGCKPCRYPVCPFGR